jgi:UDP-N-acetylglucosamine:LPS N-acetylglucosamine transferase
MSRSPAHARRAASQRLRGFGAAATFVRRTRASAVVGLGGFASVPASLAAARCGLPLLLLEQNAIPGRANRWLARWADALCLSFVPRPDAIDHVAVQAHVPTIVTGTPLRSGFLQIADDLCGASSGAGMRGNLLARTAQQPRTASLPVECAAGSSVRGECPRGGQAPAARRQQVVGTTQQLVGLTRRAHGANEREECLEFGPTLLVLGGSGGSHFLNQIMPRALAPLRTALDGWKVMHQAGHADAAVTASDYATAGIPATVVPFLQNLPSLLARTQLAVCRAGGSTLAELAVMRVPAVLVPLAGSMDHHQRANARAFAAAGAASVIEEGAGEPASLAGQLSTAIGELVADSGRRAAMSGVMGSLAKPHATSSVAEIALRLAQNGRSKYRQQSPPCLVSLPCIDSRAA